MLAALARCLKVKEPASLWFDLEDSEISKASTPSPECEFYDVMDRFRTRLWTEDPEGWEQSEGDPNHPYAFLLTCQHLWSCWWHDLGLPGHPWPKTVTEMLDPDLYR
jgi:hypothetical protein